MTGPSRFAQPWGKTADFANAVAEKLGAAFVKSWLSAKTCRFGEDTVYTIGVGQAKLAQTCENLIAQHGVRIIVCPEITRGFYAEQDARAGAKRKVGQ
jgi:hypothetical protein